MGKLSGGEIRHFDQNILFTGGKDFSVSHINSGIHLRRRD